MKVLLDECLPRKLKKLLHGHHCQTVPEIGWAGKKNGELLTLAEQAAFQVFLTLDRGLEFQQVLKSRKLAVVLMRSRSSRLADLASLGAQVLAVLATHSSW
jgi:predicted nuclease of predicted toxin-antitoxin system